MTQLIEIYQIKRAKHFKRLRAKIKHEGKVKSVWCGKQISNNEHISCINLDEGFVQITRSALNENSQIETLVLT